MYVGKHSYKYEGPGDWIARNSDVILSAMMVVFLMAVFVLGVRVWSVTHPVVKTVTVTEPAKPKPTADKDRIIREMVMLIRKDKPDMDDVHVASIAGNVWGEFDGGWDSLEQGRANTSPNVKDNDAVKNWADEHGTGIGVLQWTGSRADELIGKAKSMNRLWSDPEVQVGFLLDEVNDQSKWTGGSEDWEKANTVNTATNLMLERFVKPQDPNQSRAKRINGALDVYKGIENGSMINNQ